MTPPSTCLMAPLLTGAVVEHSGRTMLCLPTSLKTSFGWLARNVDHPIGADACLLFVTRLSLTPSLMLYLRMWRLMG
jgi:hypothetical protein